MKVWFQDDAPVAAIPADDRAALYGDGLFETIAIRRGKPRLWTYHVDRVQLGCERLGIAAPAATDLEASLMSALGAAGLDTRYAIAKLVVTAGTGRRGYKRPATKPAIRIGLDTAAPFPDEFYQHGIRVRLCNTRLAIQPQLAGMKTLNRLEQVLARAEWNEPDVVEGLTLDTDGRLICGTMSNVFARIDNQLVTPALTRCGVAGVMRRHVLTELDRQGTTVAVRDIPQPELGDIEEMFLSNSQFGVLPVAQLDDHALPVGTDTQNVMALLASGGIEEHAT